nr:hypothetical protein [Tanacetum cinerariifolium]
SMEDEEVPLVDGVFEGSVRGKVQYEERFSMRKKVQYEEEGSVRGQKGVSTRFGFRGFWKHTCHASIGGSRIIIAGSSCQS